MTTPAPTPVADLRFDSLNEELAERMGWSQHSKPYAHWRDPEGSNYLACPWPTTDPADAWRLLQWLVAQGYDVRFYPGTVQATFVRGQKAEGTDAPSLCRAALLALRSQEETPREWTADEILEREG